MITSVSIFLTRISQRIWNYENPSQGLSKRREANQKISIRMSPQIVGPSALLPKVDNLMEKWENHTKNAKPCFLKAEQSIKNRYCLAEYPTFAFRGHFIKTSPSNLLSSRNLILTAHLMSCCANTTTSPVNIYSNQVGTRPIIGQATIYARKAIQEVLYNDNKLSEKLTNQIMALDNRIRQTDKLHD